MPKKSKEISEIIKLPYFKVDETVVDPIRKTLGSACFDLPISLRAGYVLKAWKGTPLKIEETTIENIEKGITLLFGTTYLIPTGIVFDIPEGYHVQIHLRSSTGLKKHLAIPSHIGIIDSDYVEEVHVPLHVISDTRFTINNGDFLAQAMLVKNIEESLIKIDKKPKQKTTRKGGFGSTGN